ncbi:unnamed protein product [Strongylus vulgaris]|uniref:Uncharacterized protein n=1 Tax=Strongylus vulgaris TaxID=40348 RepID=A0A3P7JZ46_STRVU|nr:unnamed protein product [Strongylus vulgaris]
MALIVTAADTCTATGATVDVKGREQRVEGACCQPYMEIAEQTGDHEAEIAEQTGDHEAVRRLQRELEELDSRAERAVGF